MCKAHYSVKPILLFLFLPLLAGAQVVINEVMFDVPGADYHDEFVELYNCADSSVNLQGWQFSDSSGTDNIVDAGYGLILKPGQYAVLLDGSYFSNSTTYDSLIPDSALIIKIDDSAFGSAGLANTAGERLYLFDASGQVVDSYRYTPDNAPGYSDEKIFSCLASTGENWGNSLKLMGTPGFKNSISPRDFDLAFATDGMRLRPMSVIERNQPLSVELVYRNAGIMAFEDLVTFQCFVDLNRNDSLEVLEPIVFEEKVSVSLPPGKADSLAFVFSPSMSGNLRLVARLNSSRDQNLQNNSVWQEITVREAQNSLVLNEIKFLPATGESEWVEVFNASDAPMLLKGWGIADEKDTARIEESVAIGPRQYRVLAADQSVIDYYSLPGSLVVVLKNFPRLNNDEDRLLLLTPWGEWAEQVHYKKEWLKGEEWRKPSLERVNPQLDARLAENWGPSVDAEQATPGRVNSIFEGMAAASAQIEIDPNPFSPDDDGEEDYTIIRVRLPLNSARIRILIFDMVGRQVLRLTDNQFTGSTFEIAWDGRDDRGRKVRMGIYVVYVQVLNASEGVLKELKQTVVVAYR